MSNARGTNCDLGASTEGSPCTKENEGCDETLGDLGDVYDSSDYEDEFACSTDKKTRLVCKSNEFVKDKACKCSVLIDKVNCD